MAKTKDGFEYRDLNGNGQLDVYEDTRRPIEERVEDLLAQMTLAEKAGLMFHTIAAVNPDGSLEPPAQGFMRTPIREMVVQGHMNHFNVHGLPAPRVAAEWSNRLQALAESTRLGIPVTLSSDPRHAFSDNPLAGMMAGHFSQWPEPLGLAAIDDEDLVEEFADIARREYLAQGIRVALHPMADLATEPRWGRNNGTFGEDAELSSRLTAAYIRGFQGPTLGSESVACMTKHFPGGGPQKDGEDPHFSYGKEQVYPGANFDYHLKPFEAAFEAGTAQIMPYYGQPIGTEYEEVGFAFSKGIITDLLRGRYGFDGVVCTDWGLLTDREIAGVVWEARAWGVEDLSRPERAKKILDAGVDQFGGEACPEVIVELVESGQVSETRIDESVRRLLRDKFRLDLFDNPYLDPDAAEQIVGNPEFVAAGQAAQRKSIVLLKNDTMLPIQGRPKLYVENIDSEVASKYGEIVTNLGDADLAILRLKTPFEHRDGHFLEQLFHTGHLDFQEPEKSRILELLTAKPTIIDIYLERPAVLPELAAKCGALLANFGADDRAVLDVIFGQAPPTGKLPFEMPSSMAAVLAQASDVPYDSERPLFPFSHGLTYS